MMGLPTETLEDIEGIAQTAQRVVELFYQNPNRPKGKSVQVSISVACFVPKPHTPFEFVPQDTQEVLREKQQHLLHSVKSRKISEEAVRNRQLLRLIMREAGFRALNSEWWHFNLCSREVAKQRYKRIE